jgi:hypothetical protein
MLPVFALAMARDAVARQFDYDDSAMPDVAPSARPRRQRVPRTTLRQRFGGAVVRAGWSPSH